jgi:translation initiation factor 6
MLRLMELGGNSNLGVYLRATEKLVFYGEPTTKKEVADLEEALGVPGIRISVGGSTVVGSLIAANQTGAVVADILTREESRRFDKTGLNILPLPELLNAAGNNILCTDAGALVNPEYSDEALALISKTLGVPVTRGTLGGIGTVGMAGVATRLGVLVHQKATPEEREIARRALGAEVMLGTVNHGNALVGAGLAANSKGAVIGRESTGIEMNRIEEALGFLPPQ